MEAKIKPLCPAAYMAANVVAQLDVLLAFASAAEKNNWNRPDVRNDAEGKSGYIYVSHQPRDGVF